MTSTNSTGSKQFDALGLKKIINGRSWVTILGGSRMPEEVQGAMTDAANTFIDFHELNKRAGTLIAEYTGAEAGLVVAGASAGMYGWFRPRSHLATTRHERNERRNSDF